MQRREFLERSAAGSLACLAAGLSPETAAAAESANVPTELIIDTHVHLWDLKQFKLPWLSSAAALLKRNYLEADYRQATSGLKVKSLYMEVNVEPSQEVAEAEYVVELARRRDPIVAGVIGGRPESPEFPAYLERFRGKPEIKGVRRVLHDPEVPPGHCLQEAFVKHVRLLGEYGLSFDFCMRPTDLGDTVKLAAACPQTRFILDHCGNGDLRAFRRLKADEPPAKHTADAYKKAIEQLAARPNVICKISGLMFQFPQGGDAGDLAPVVNVCLDAFGPDRVVFGSDWPVCLVGGSLRSWVEMLSQIIATRPAAERKKLWSENAIRFYGLGV